MFACIQLFRKRMLVLTTNDYGIVLITPMPL
jgi:hypothetical protein